MPVKTLKRVQTGVTNKSASQSKLDVKACLCQTCTCGQHVCSEKHKNGESSIPNTRNLAFSGQSETQEQYKSLKDVPPHFLVCDTRCCFS